MSCTLTQLINLLTRPLILTHPAIQITHLQLALHANLASFFGNDCISPFTLHLTAHSLPVTPIYAACLASGVSWDSWVSTLSQGKEMYVFVMEGCIRVGYAGQDVVTVWKKEEEELKDSQVPKISTRYRVSRHVNSELYSVLMATRPRFSPSQQVSTLPRTNALVPAPVPPLPARFHR